MKFNFGVATVNLEANWRKRKPRGTAKLTPEERIDAALEAANWMMQRAVRGEAYSRRSRPRWMTQPAWQAGRKLAHTSGVFRNGRLARPDASGHEMYLRLKDKADMYRKLAQGKNYELPF